jgi:hypothetical protein
MEASWAADLARWRRERAELKRRYGPIFDELRRAFNRHDPIGLLSAGAPEDEYEAEVGAVLTRLPATASLEDVRRLVHEEFVRWFGEDVAGTETRYLALAGDVWAIRQRVA